MRAGKCVLWRAQRRDWGGRGGVPSRFQETPLVVGGFAACGEDKGAAPNITPSPGDIARVPAAISR